MLASNSRDKLPLHEALWNAQKRVDERLEEKRWQQLQDEHRECTFQPNVQDRRPPTPGRTSQSALGLTPRSTTPRRVFSSPVFQPPARSAGATGHAANVQLLHDSRRSLQQAHDAVHAAGAVLEEVRQASSSPRASPGGRRRPSPRASPLAATLPQSPNRV